MKQKTALATEDAPEHFCNVHAETLLVWTSLGYVCPEGCGWEQAGRRWKRD